MYVLRDYPAVIKTFYCTDDTCAYYYYNIIYMYTTVEIKVELHWTVAILYLYTHRYYIIVIIIIRYCYENLVELSSFRVVVIYYIIILYSVL